MMNSWIQSSGSMCSRELRREVLRSERRTPLRQPWRRWPMLWASKSRRRCRLVRHSPSLQWQSDSSLPCSALHARGTALLCCAAELSFGECSLRPGAASCRTRCWASGSTCRRSSPSSVVLSCRPPWRLPGTARGWNSSAQSHVWPRWSSLGRCGELACPAQLQVDAAFCAPLGPRSLMPSRTCTKCARSVRTSGTDAGRTHVIVAEAEAAAASGRKRRRRRTLCRRTQCASLSRALVQRRSTSLKGISAALAAWWSSTSCGTSARSAHAVWPLWPCSRRASTEGRGTPSR
mmetsp:Transcript_29592/g.81360  ORF Transcript_29592/g.81360 Transcript_29592/m.81360 type:complete len:291 (-) Transcript_29592:1575-2447(-)